MFFFYSIFRPTVDFCLDFSASCDGSDYYWRMPQMYFPLLNFIPRYGSDLDDNREFESMPQPSNQAKHQLYCDLTWLTGRQHVASSFFAPFCLILPISPNLPFLLRLNMSVGHQVRHISENYRIFPDLSTVNIFAGKILVWSASLQEEARICPSWLAPRWLNWQTKDFLARVGNCFVLLCGEQQAEMSWIEETAIEPWSWNDITLSVWYDYVWDQAHSTLPRNTRWAL